MPSNDTLTPIEAARVATNSYFTLKGWINEHALIGVERPDTIANRVLGAGDIGKNQPKKPTHVNPTLAQTELRSAQIRSVHSATTGIGISSGFGYTLRYKDAFNKTHAIIATRGTRPGLAFGADVITDLRLGMTQFGSYGPVHIGFAKTFDSILPSLVRDQKLLETADVVHCVGHSLGGAVATLIAAHYVERRAKGAVKLYTFGSPRVGCHNSHMALETRIGRQNIFRVAHQLDPVSLIPCYPYEHVNGERRSTNNFTISSPIARLSMGNHDMAEYMQSTEELLWPQLQSEALALQYFDDKLAAWLLAGSDANASWVHRGSSATLALLVKMLGGLLKELNSMLIVGATVVDVLAELLIKGCLAGMKAISKWITWAAQWAGIVITKSADVNALIVRYILERMTATLRQLAVLALNTPTMTPAPVKLAIAGAFALTHAGVL